MSEPEQRTRGRITTRTHRDLIVWRESMRLLTEVYRLAPDLPPFELYGLSSQLRRAALSIPTNIAEGFGRRAPRELRHSLSIAEGSLRELQTLLEATIMLGYFSRERLAPPIARGNRVGYVIHRFAQTVRPRCVSPGPP